MGRSYWFECSRCGYRTVACGKADRGADFFAVTVSCAECKKLYDVVTRLRVPAPGGLKGGGVIAKSAAPATAPPFQAAVTRLPMSKLQRTRWKSYDPVCPVSKLHHVQKWTDPGACPRCGLPMEKNPLPYKIWE